MPSAIAMPKLAMTMKEGAVLDRAAAGLRAWPGTRESELERVAARTPGIAADEDRLTPGAAGLSERIPGARLLVVPRAGHTRARGG